MDTVLRDKLTAAVNGAFEPFSDPIELAEHLADIGITGKRGGSSLCPLSQMLTAMMDGRTVHAYIDSATVVTDDNHVVCVDFPRVAASFVVRFDNGEFSYLVERDPDDDEVSDEDA